MTKLIYTCTRDAPYAAAPSGAATPRVGRNVYMVYSTLKCKHSLFNEIHTLQNLAQFAIKCSKLAKC